MEDRTTFTARPPQYAWIPKLGFVRLLKKGGVGNEGRLLDEIDEAF